MQVSLPFPNFSEEKQLKQVLSDEGPTLETLDFAFRLFIGSLPTLKCIWSEIFYCFNGKMERASKGRTICSLPFLDIFSSSKVIKI